MAVYVSSPPRVHKLLQFTKLLADTEEELHEFAKKIGATWYNQDPIPHYELPAILHERALHYGAVTQSWI